LFETRQTFSNKNYNVYTPVLKASIKGCPTILYRIHIASSKKVDTKTVNDKN